MEQVFEIQHIWNIILSSQRQPSSFFKCVFMLFTVKFISIHCTHMLFSRVELPFGLLSAVEKPVELQDFGKAFPQRELSCVSSSCFHQKMLQHIVHMQKAFLQCVVTKWTFKLFQHEKTFIFFLWGGRCLGGRCTKKWGGSCHKK